LPGARRLLPQRLIAFVGHGVERLEIDDFDDATGIADCASRLYITGHRGDRRAANAKHLGERFLREHYRVAFDCVTDLQQPAAEPCLDWVQGVTRRVDPRLTDINLSGRSLFLLIFSIAIYGTEGSQVSGEWNSWCIRAADLQFARNVLISIGSK
jgi:hypothetical protein